MSATGTGQKIGMILDTDFPPDPRVENEAHVLRRAGYEIHLFAFSFNREFQAYEEFEGIHVYRYYCSSILYKLSALAYTFPFYHNGVSKMIQDFVDRTRVPFVHIHDIQVARAVFALKNRTTFKITLDLHENRPEIMRYYKHVQSLRGKLLISPTRWKKNEEKYASEADGVVVVTPSAKAELSARADIDPGKIVVAPNVVQKHYQDIASIKQEIVDRYQESFVLLYLGDTSKRRGLDIALESVSLLKDKIANIKLVVVGSSSYDQELHQKAVQLGVQDQVDFEGWQTDRLFPSYIKSSHICISPLERNIHHDTTYANKLFQYMGMGGVLLVSDCTAQADLVEETNCGYVHKSESVSDFTEKVLKLYDSEEDRNQFSENGIKAVNDKYNWEISGQELVRYYDGLI